MRNAKDGRTLNTRVFETLREEILTGKLLPGQRLKVATLAETHGVSLNVVREALNRLAGERLVDIEQQFGFTVRRLSADDLKDLVRQRVILEGLALRESIAHGDVNWQSQVIAAHHRLAKTPMSLPEDPDTLNPEWLKRHDEFNFVMMQACGSPRLFQMVRQLAEAAEIYHRALLPSIRGNRPLEDEHSALLAALLAGDADSAVAVLTSHLEMTRDMMLPLLDQDAHAGSVAPGPSAALAHGREAAQAVPQAARRKSAATTAKRKTVKPSAPRTTSRRSTASGN